MQTATMGFQTRNDESTAVGVSAANRAFFAGISAEMRARKNAERAAKMAAISAYLADKSESNYSAMMAYPFCQE